MTATYLLKIFHNIQHSNRVCCQIDSKEYTYQDLKNRISVFASNIQSVSSKRIGVVLNDDFDTYCHIIACWMFGKAYVPLNPNYPIQRLKDICDLADLTHIIGVPSPQIRALNVIEITEDSPYSEWTLAEVQATAEAYVLFTSGTTGKPKGVPISILNLNSFYEGFFDLGYKLSENDRFLQMFDLTFDLSVMSFMIPLSLGASFYTLSKSMVKPLALYDTLESNKISFALMVPSAVEMLEPYQNDIELNELRYTQFCGEAFKEKQFNIWRTCAPFSQIDNVYGPTEATIYCTRYMVYSENNQNNHFHKQGIFSIGHPMKHTRLYLDEENELLLGGSQVTSGYLKPNSQMINAFIQVGDERYYRSGDTANFEDGLYYCHGRKDDQVKIQGYRVELSEIEYAASNDFPNIANKAIILENSIHLIIKTIQDVHLSDIEQSLNQKLPWYMRPNKIHFISEFPLNANGKIDKNALKEWIQSK